MNYNRKNTTNELISLSRQSSRRKTRSIVTIIKAVLLGIIFVGVIGGCAFFGMVKGVLDNSPSMGDIDVSPKGLATTIYDADGNLIETLVASGANRSPVTYDQIPRDMINAIIAIEDSRFLNHEGVDLRGIVRSSYLLFQSGGSTTQGASTLTQQLIKNNVFDGGQEKTLGARFVRKIQEQYLAIELEKVMSKEKILENYLNTINLGANCLGVQTAAKRYFGKDITDLTLSECATIAGITQNPYKYNPITHPDKNAEKRAIVLDYMEKDGYISAEQKAEALADNVYDRIQEVNATYSTARSPYSYFVDRLTKEVRRDLQAAGYSEEQTYSLLYSGGLKIYTTQDPWVQEIIDRHVNDPVNYNEAATMYSFTYTLSIKSADGVVTKYTENNVKEFYGGKLDFSKRDEIDNLIQDYKTSILQNGDTIVGENLDVTLQPQTSVVVMDQSNGKVLGLTGGRGDKTASLSLNRATDTRRQPGSTFKVLTSFGPAIDNLGDTLATTYYDEPYTYQGNAFRNWYSGVYAGYANLRQGIVYSMNIVALKCMAETVTPEVGFAYAENFGINTLVKNLDTVLPLALGGVSQGVTNMQLTAAYATIANEGEYIKPILYTRILDSDGKIIIDNQPVTRQVIKDTTAFLLTSAMADSMVEQRLNGLFHSSSPQAHLDNMSAAGKSGTTSDTKDLWFVGFTPYYTMGIWSGFDDNSDLPDGIESNFHKAIWKKIMSDLTDGKPDIGFNKPDNIVECKICAKSGKLATDACEADHAERGSIVYTEYFVDGTQPTEKCDLHFWVKVCPSSGLKPNRYCPYSDYEFRIKLPDEVTGDTQDTAYSKVPTSYCNKHFYIPPETTAPSSAASETGSSGASGGSGSSGSSSSSGSSGNSGGSSSSNNRNR